MNGFLLYLGLCSVPEPVTFHDRERFPPRHEAVSMRMFLSAYRKWLDEVEPPKFDYETMRVPEAWKAWERRQQESYRLWYVWDLVADMWPTEPDSRYRYTDDQRMGWLLDLKRNLTTEQWLQGEVPLPPVGWFASME